MKDTGNMIQVGIVGGTGYTGVELLRLLAAHPQVEFKAITSRSEAGVGVEEIFPNLRGHLDLEFSVPDLSVLSSCDLVFFATPNGIAMGMAQGLVDAGVRVIDLAADFRIKDIPVWERWYGMAHAAPELVDEAVYGLPELNRDAIKDARIIANPGCYPTAVTLGLLPLVKDRLADVSRIIADAKSGVSGAGRGANVGTLFSEVDSSFKAYATSGHRHLPEISQNLRLLAGRDVGITFVPHLLPMVRGIHATLYAEVADHGVDLQKRYEDLYRDEPFVDVLPEGSHPETRSVRGGNICRMAIHRPQGGHTVVILSVIDNLVKGAAGQAVHNMNIAFGFDEMAGLNTIPQLP